MRPNVLLVVLDTARRDAFEPYGAATGSSPAVAQLARAGTALELAFASSSWTVPSHASMLTGLLPRAWGIAQGRTPPEFRPLMRAHLDRALPEVMRLGGYATAAVSTNLWISEQSGFDAGFEEFVLLNSGRQGRLDDVAVRGRLRWAVEAARARVDDGAAEAEQVLLRWLEGERDRPFFWFVNLIECHSPYLPPHPYNDLPILERLRAAEDARRYLSLEAIWRACAGGFDVPAESLERMRHLYARAVRLMDDWLGRVLEALDARGLLDDTIVVVTSDHGENFGEGELIGHSFSLDNRLTHVPLVAAGPLTLRARDVFSLAELPRMIGDAVELADHPWREDELPAGVALAQLKPPTGPDDPRARETVAGWGLDEEALRRATTALAFATDGRHKLLRRGEREELYDLEADPLELRPLPADGDEHPLPRLRAALRHPAAAAVHTFEPPQATPEELAEIESRMRLLGYM
jgi:arylsulfatase A-like enzyme